MSNIRIDIASEFKDKGFKAAEKRTTSLNRKFDNLTRSARRTFIAIAGFQALRRSVEAFAAEDKAANKLAASLRNLGLAYNTRAIEEYLESSEKATAINKDQLCTKVHVIAQLGNGHFDQHGT
jgi:non-ribosomal peptide synthetase component E (peptide arylation enzyme)